MATDARQVDGAADRVFAIPADALQDDEGMEAAELEGVHSGLSRSDCGLRQPTPSLTPANATVLCSALSPSRAVPARGSAPAAWRDRRLLNFYEKCLLVAISMIVKNLYSAI
jgi:hypothetical protein